VKPAKNISPAMRAMMTRNLFGMIIPFREPVPGADQLLPGSRSDKFSSLPFYDSLTGKNIGEKRQ
jgi:hypothetical protein